MRWHFTRLIWPFQPHRVRARIMFAAGWEEKQLAQVAQLDTGEAGLQARVSGPSALGHFLHRLSLLSSVQLTPHPDASPQRHTHSNHKCEEGLSLFCSFFLNPPQTFAQCRTNGEPNVSCPVNSGVNGHPLRVHPGSSDVWRAPQAAPWFQNSVKVSQGSLFRSVSCRCMTT